MLIGMLFLNPLLSLGVGAGSGALCSYMADIGIDDKSMKSVGEELKPGRAALSVLVRKTTGDKVIERLRDFAGTGSIFQTSLSETFENELRAMLERSR